MSILMVLIGATIGATIGSLFMHWRSDVAKDRQQLESKTPYDYALTNAINERDRLQGELFTIKALKRTEADTERIRNEIGTVLSDDGEEPTESVYDVDEAFMNSTDLTFRQYYDVIKTTDDKRLPDEAVSPTSWDARMSLEEWAKGVSKAFASGYGTNVREDDTKDEQSSEDGVEHAYYKVRLAFLWRTPVAVNCGDRIVTGEITGFSFEGEELADIEIDCLDLDVNTVEYITKGRSIDGETLYRKGNR